MISILKRSTEILYCIFLKKEKSFVIKFKDAAQLDVDA